MASIEDCHCSNLLLAVERWDPDLEDVLMIMRHARCDCGVIGAQDSNIHH